ncbi:MAG: hypothetical protein Q7S33_01025 [Nanoarchaeota archaeon]|nr:hypothetical protein [Nanoarchaeota archaeon]
MEDMEILEKGIKIHNFLEEILIQFCQDLPFDARIFEENKQCIYPSEICKYCIRKRDDAFSGKESIYLCSKVLID